ncbi:MAG: hypothetical protein AAGC81_03280 [Pseudomonadota bacterium]
MVVLVIAWSIAGYGLLAAILFTTGYDVVKGKNYLAATGLAALFFSPHIFGYVLDSFVVVLNTEIILLSPTVLGIISIFIILSLITKFKRTEKTLILCSAALVVSVVFIGCYSAIVISSEERWTHALPELLAVLMPPMMLGGVPFIFHRALRRLMTLRGA